MAVKEVECDIVVIGVGAMGSATLDQLAMKGVNVVGIDRFAPPHDRGSSHGSTRVTRESLGEGPMYVQFVRESHKRWKELERESGEKLFKQCGTLMIDESHKDNVPDMEDDFMKNTFDVAERYGIEHEKLDREQVLSRFPALSGMSVDDIAYYEPGSGYVCPEKCIDAQIKHAISKGARMFSNDVVTSIRNTESGVTVSTDNLLVKASKAIVSGGAWIPDILGEKYKKLFTVRRQVIFWFALEEPNHFTPESPVFIWEDGMGDAGHFYGFPPLPGEDSIKIGTGQRRTTTHPDNLDRTVTDEEAKNILDTHLKARISGVSDRLVKAYACLTTYTPDNDFILDYHPEMANVFVVAACSGHGFKHSAGVGIAVAKQIVGQDSEFDLSPFGFNRFSLD